MNYLSDQLSNQINCDLNADLERIESGIISNIGGTTVVERKTDRVSKLSPRYKVLLHNDPVNSMEYVVKTLRQVVPQLSEQDAIAVMLEAHNTGIGLVIICDLEPAEFYSETLKSKGLVSTIEKEN